MIKQHKCMVNLMDFQKKTMHDVWVPVSYIYIIYWPHRTRLFQPFPTNLCTLFGISYPTQLPWSFAVHGWPTQAIAFTHHGLGQADGPGWRGGGSTAVDGPGPDGRLHHLRLVVEIPWFTGFHTCWVVSLIASININLVLPEEFQVGI